MQRIASRLTERGRLPAVALVVAGAGVIGGVWGRRAIAEFGAPPITQVRLLNDAGALESRPLCCTDQRVPMRVRNDSHWKTAEIDTIKSSCGCLSVKRWPAEIVAGGEGEFELALSPGPFEDRYSVTLTLVGTSGHTRSIPVAGAVLPPFTGWPQAADGARVEGRVELRIDPRYLDLVGDVLLFSKWNEPLGVEFDRERGIVRADAVLWESGEPEMVMVFKSGQRWAGPFGVGVGGPAAGKGSL